MTKRISVAMTGMIDGDCSIEPERDGAHELHFAIVDPTTEDGDENVESVVCSLLSRKPFMQEVVDQLSVGTIVSVYGKLLLMRDDDDTVFNMIAVEDMRILTLKSPETKFTSHRLN
jgi:hypothetical protein